MGPGLALTIALIIVFFILIIRDNTEGHPDEMLPNYYMRTMTVVSSSNDPNLIEIVNTEDDVPIGTRVEAANGSYIGHVIASTRKNNITVLTLNTMRASPQPFIRIYYTVYVPFKHTHSTYGT